MNATCSVSTTYVAPVINDTAQTLPVALNVVPVAPQVASVVDELPKRLLRLIATVDVGWPTAMTDT